MTGKLDGHDMRAVRQEAPFCAVWHWNPPAVCEWLLDGRRRLLLFGPPGVGKSTLAAALGRELAAGGEKCWCLGADPGSPAFGPPGAVTLARWEGTAWRPWRCEALCTLDAARFRLPLLTAVARLARAVSRGVLLVDGPGVVRGAAGAELLPGLVEAAVLDAVVVLSMPGRTPPLPAELAALGVAVARVTVSHHPASPSRRQRARSRTAAWESWLQGAGKAYLNLDDLPVVGMPPPPEPAAWLGRQVALLGRGVGGAEGGGQTLALGEVLALSHRRLALQLLALDGGRVPPAGARALLVRDAQRGVEGFLETAPPYLVGPAGYTGNSGNPPCAGKLNREVLPVGAITARVGSLWVDLVNGVFGDPLLHLRLAHEKRSLLFDLGEGGRLPARLAHQVTDVFVSHAHLDHISGFLWLLRSRIGEFPACRLYGPPGLACHIAGFLRGVLWDRVGMRAPRFEVIEASGESLRRFVLQVGDDTPRLVSDEEWADGVLLAEPGFRVRAVTLDHGGTPVLAFAYEPSRQIQVRKDRLRALGLGTGPWLGELKRRLLADDLEASIPLPDGTVMAAGELGRELTLVAPGKRLVYATDLADTPGNRARLVDLARHAHTLFCEAAFAEADGTLAGRSGHLTARACGEIATAAGVARLIPFHFSRRYEKCPERLCEEIRAAFSRVLLPFPFPHNIP